jgi:triacylglycerol lipase
MPPVILHHGLFGYDELKLGPVRVTYFSQIGQGIGRLGHPWFATRVHPTASIERRATQLKQQILDRLQADGLVGQRAVIVAHSMGGLDARYMVSRLGMARHVSAVLTVCTPHRGSPYADWVVRNLHDRVAVLPMVRKLGLDVGAAADLTTAACAKFNDAVPDHPDVRYFSISAARPFKQMPAFALHPHHVVSSAEGENDGLVSVASATWGTHLCTWPLDHWQAINRHFAIRHKADDCTPRYLDALAQVFGQCVPA